MGLFFILNPLNRQVLHVIHHIPNVLSKEQVAEFRTLMHSANWVNGKVTAGTLSASVKQSATFRARPADPRVK